MSALARYYHLKGCNVSGYDRSHNMYTDELEQLGIAIHYDSDASWLESAPMTPDNTPVSYTHLTVDLGEEEPVQIVCGAPNVAAGQTVVVATVGTTLYGPDGEPFKIKKSKLRGEPSMGMICSQVEIGMGADSSGIWVLDDETVKPGTPAADYFDLASDTVIEIDITPNRCLLYTSRCV